MRLPKTHSLTAARARELLLYDPATGILTWRISRPGCVAGTAAGTVNGDGYRQVEIDFVIHRAPRIIWLMMTGRWPRGQVDHKNRNRADDRWDNLRDATPRENARNRTPTASNKSGAVGVCASGERWAAYIGLPGDRTIRLGTFDHLPDAIAARQAAERQHFGRFAPSIEPEIDDLVVGGAQ